MQVDNMSPLPHLSTVFLIAKCSLTELFSPKLSWLKAFYCVESRGHILYVPVLLLIREWWQPQETELQQLGWCV